MFDHRLFLTKHPAKRYRTDRGARTPKPIPYVPALYFHSLVSSGPEPSIALRHKMPITSKTNGDMRPATTGFSATHALNLELFATLPFHAPQILRTGKSSPPFIHSTPWSDYSPPALAFGSQSRCRLPLMRAVRMSTTVVLPALVVAIAAFNV